MSAQGEGEGAEGESHAKTEMLLKALREILVWELDLDECMSPLTLHDQ